MTERELEQARAAGPELLDACRDVLRVLSPRAQKLIPYTIEKLRRAVRNAEGGGVVETSPRGLADGINEQDLADRWG